MYYWRDFKFDVLEGDVRAGLVVVFNFTATMGRVRTCCACNRLGPALLEQY